MSDNSRSDPDKGFPEDLTLIDRDDLDILNSRNHRARDWQYVRDGEVDAETDGQHHDLRNELDRRQSIRDAPADGEATSRAEEESAPKADSGPGRA